MSNLSPPPVREKYPVTKDQGGKYWAEIPTSWLKWFSTVQTLLAPVASGGLLLWNSVSKVGSNITDIVTRNHDDLQNLNTATHTHLSSANATDLTDSGDSTLHYHASDRNRANHTGTQTAATISDFQTTVSANTDVAANTAARHVAVTVTDTATLNLTLTGQDIKGDVDLAAVNYISSANATDLTDGGSTVLHYHNESQSDVTASRALDSTYTAPATRSVMVNATIRCAITLAGGNAYVQGKSDASSPPTTVASGIVGIQAGLLGEDNTLQIIFVVAPGMNYKITSSSTNGTCTLDKWFEVTF